MVPTGRDQPEIAPGTILGERFRIVRAVGSGGMGTVYEALDLKLDRRVALKCARPGFRYRLPPEARAAREVSHFNVCKVHEFHTLSTPDGELDCLSMEFIEGETLSHRIRSTGPLVEQTAREVARQICAGLEQAHRQGVIHGDLKCGNVILSQSPEGRTRAVITDFGLARIAGEVREEDSSGGTYDYMAPEIFLGEPATVPSDLYALGVLFHVMLTGHAPRRLHDPPQKPEHWTPDSDKSTRTAASEALSETDWRREIDPLPTPWKSVVTRCIAPRLEERFQSVAAVMNTLEPRRRILKAVAAVLVAALLILGGREWRNQMSITPVRLAVLPFTMEGDRLDSIAGIGVQVAERLAGARSKFTVISPREAERNQATTPEKARKILGATHVLETHVHVAGGTITVNASLLDVQSGRTVRELQGSYSAADGLVLEKALIGTVTEAFRLPARSQKESVSAAAYPYYVQGIDLLRRDIGNGDKAIPLFTKAIELDPRSALPYAGLAEAHIQRIEYHDSSRLDAAEAAAAKAASINPDSVPVLLASGSVQEERGRYEKAIALFTRATEIGPNDAETWRRLAVCYERANRPDDAVATYQRAIQAQPDYYRTYLSLGTFHMNRGQFPRAEQQYRRVLEIAPDLETGHMNLGLALMQQRKYPAAESQLLEALRLRRSPNSLLNIGALYYAEERFDLAASYFEQSLAAGTVSAVIFRNLGDAYRQLGKSQEAKSAYERAKKLAEEDITRNPRRAASHSMLGLLNARLGDRERAAFEISQALAIDSENRSVLRDAAIAYESMGRRDDALSALRKAPGILLEELSHQPDVKGLSQDPRFKTLLSNTPTQ